MRIEWDMVVDGDGDVNGVATVDLSRWCVHGGDHVQVHVAVNAHVHGAEQNSDSWSMRFRSAPRLRGGLSQASRGAEDRP